MGKIILLPTGLIFSQIAFADNYTCTQGSASRHISVEDEQGQEVPCQVKYDKPDQASVEYPWQAESTRGYCEDKTEYLASRLESFGRQRKVDEDQAIKVNGADLQVVDIDEAGEHLGS